MNAGLLHFPQKENFKVCLRSTSVEALFNLMDSFIPYNYKRLFLTCVYLINIWNRGCISTLQLRKADNSIVEHVLLFFSLQL